MDACIRARLFETNTGNLLYDRVFLNSNRNRYPYHSYILPSECRKIEDYCGEEGANILRRELNKAIDASVEEVVRDLSPQTE